MSHPVIDGKLFINHLRQFNRKERFYLIGTALGNPKFRLSKHFRNQLKTVFVGDHVIVPPEAFVAMDYHLDWLYASLFLASNGGKAGPHPWVKQKMTATQEDIDLLVAYLDGDTCHVILLEAKGVLGFTNKQMRSKAKRLRKIFGEDGQDFCRVTPHFAIVTDGPTDRLKTTGWPAWMRKTNGRRIAIGLPSGLKKVTQCDPCGKPKKGGPRWTVKDDRKSVRSTRALSTS